MKHDDYVIDQLKNSIGVLDQAFIDKKPFYEMGVIDSEGERTILETRENYLEFLINVANEQLSLLLEEIEERNQQKQKFKVIK